jgi:hypothetical protein
MPANLNRRDFLRLAALGGGVAFASALPGWAAARDADFFFVQLSDAHWGFEGPAINPDAKGTLPKAIAAVNALPVAPDFVVFTGDLTHTTDDPAVRRTRMREFQAIVAGLKAKPLYLMPGEHDASLDNGEAFRELFGPTHYTFDHRGVHFVVLDNVSDPAGRVGDAQIAWLADDLSHQAPDARIVVFTHRPLFDLAPQWDWATRDGAAAAPAVALGCIGAVQGAGLAQRGREQRAADLRTDRKADSRSGMSPARTTNTQQHSVTTRKPPCPHACPRPRV